MRRLAAFAAVLLLGLTSACTTAAAGSGVVEGTVIAAADRPPAPAVTGALLDGSGNYDLAAHKGDVVVVNFWGSWCGPCVAEADAFEQAYQATKASGVTFVGVNVRDVQDSAKDFARLRLTYPSIFDPAGKVALGFTVTPTTPSTYIVDRQGRLAFIARRPVLKTELEPVLQQLAGEPRP
jgi:thiol-disulfide isomerase/thioredoxin